MKKAMAVILIGCLMSSVMFAADEITMMGYIKAAKGYMKLEKSPGTITINMTGIRYNSKIYALTTNAWQALEIGACATNGIVYLRNVGSQGSVKVSFDVGTTTHLVVKTNEFYMFRLDPGFTATNVHFLAVQPSTNVIAAYDFEATILED